MPHAHGHRPGQQQAWACLSAWAGWRGKRRRVVSLAYVRDLSHSDWPNNCACRWAQPSKPGSAAILDQLRLCMARALSEGPALNLLQHPNCWTAWPSSPPWARCAWRRRRAKPWPASKPRRAAAPYLAKPPGQPERIAAQAQPVLRYGPSTTWCKAKSKAACGNGARAKQPNSFRRIRWHWQLAAPA